MGCGVGPALNPLKINMKINSPVTQPPPTIQSLEGYSLSPQEKKAISTQLKTVAQTRLEGHVREAALTRMSRMKDK